MTEAEVASAIHKHRWPAASGATKNTGQGVYLFHGLGEHGGRYAHVAQWFVQRGYQVGAHDHPGHGRSEGDRGILATDSTIADNAIEQFNEFAQTCNGPPLLVGHSLGGALAANLVLKQAIKVSGLILSAPAFEPDMTRWQQTQLNLMHLLAKDLPVTARLSGPLLTHDEGKRAAWEADELIHRTVSARLIKWLIATGAEALKSAPTLDIRTLLLVPQADVIVRPQASGTFAKNAPVEQLTHIKYPALYHEIFNETPVDRERVFNDIAAWLDSA